MKWALCLINIITYSNMYFPSGVCFSCKWVGLFVILWAGITTVMNLWDLLGDLSLSLVSAFSLCENTSPNVNVCGLRKIMRNPKVPGHEILGALELRRRANARNVSFLISLRWTIHIINPVDKTKLSCNTPTDAAPQFL